MINNRQLFHDHLGQTSQFPLGIEVAHAQGLYLTDINGHQYLDLISGIGVSSVGHRHPDVTKAIKDQVDKYMHVMVYGEFVKGPQVQLAKALSDTLPDHLDNVFLVNSGSEATEGAIKLAKRYTGKTKVISCHNAYHGSTSGALSVCGSEDLKSPFRPLIPETYQVEFNNENELELIDSQTAAVIIEPIQGEAGVRIGNGSYFKKLRAKCTEMGALLIFDEIQCGFGRSGKFWAHEYLDASPDILLCAKGMGGGMPIGAFISSKNIMQILTHNPILGHITTFGGHPVSAAASLATINLMMSSDMVEQAHAKGELFKELLIHEKILDIRGMGLMLAVEFESFDFLQKIIHELLNLGILSDWFLFCDNSMRIAPPLVISDEEIKMACSKILQAINSCLRN